ncbi:MAG: DUF2779 domain-containing protein [Solobacterium sp.]|jgi:hypothetical protein|nr:DUF2779 domain-containing protein [Solobacterium sp.]
MYHISDCKKFNRCPRLFLQSRQEETHPLYQSYVRLDEAVTDLAVQKLGIKDYFLGQRSEEPEHALEALKTYDWLVKARFEYQDLRVKVPFLHRNGDGWDLYFLFAGLYPHASDIQFYNDMVWVLKGNHINLKEIRMIHLNADYVRGTELDPIQLFTISDSFYNDRCNPTIQIKQCLEQNETDLTDLLKRMKAAEEGPMPSPQRSNRCAGRQKCRFYDDCFQNEVQQPCDSILTLIGAKARYDMMKEGRTRLKDADETRIEGTRQQYAEIMADRSGGLYADQIALKTWMSDIQYPISFLDFEWECYAIPPYEGMKPYDVLPFEYSLHIMQEDGSLTHKVFLSIHDDREELADSLIKEIPETGSIVAYNAYGAEQIRIQELADRFKDKRAKLLNMNARMKDLQMPFLLGTVYDTRMNGCWTLKQIMSMMDDPGYQDLEIRKGMDAVFQWRHLDREEEDEATSREIVEGLKAYCGMDSYAMTVVYHWLQGIIESQKEVQ